MTTWPPTRNTRPVSWLKAARRDFEDFPQGAQIEMGLALTILAEGGWPDITKPLHGFGSGIVELALRYKSDAFRTVFALQIDHDLWAIHAFQKKSKTGIKTPKMEIDPRTAQTPKGDVEMTKKTKHESFGIIRGSGNVFRDLGHPNPDLEQFKAILAARIIRVLNDRKLSVRAAAKLTGFAAADFSRIRNVKLGRFTIDRLMLMLDRLGQEVKISIKVHPRAKYEHATGLPA